VSYLLDTNVVSEIRRGRDANVQAWAGQVAGTDLYLSVLTVGEIRKGVDRLCPRDPSQADVFETWLADLAADFGERVLAIDARVAAEWGRRGAPSERKTVDSLIAATALVHGLTVATRNTADFDGCGVPLINPWQPRRMRGDTVR
jgi:predicted nucleic acid-binding protein